MKIAIITNSHRIDDTRLYWKIGLTLASHNEVTIIGFKGNAVEDSPVNFVRRQELDTLDNLIELYKFANSYKPDVLICVEPLTLIVGILLKRKTKLKLFYDCHEFFAEAFAERYKGIVSLIAEKAYKTVEDFLVKRATGILVVNSLLKERFKKHNNVRVVSNYPTVISKMSALEYEYDVIYAGGIVKDRGVTKLIIATSMLKSAFPNIRVLILGRVKNDLLVELQQLVLEHELVDNVQIKPEVSVNEAQRYISTSKIGISVLNPKIKRFEKAIPLKTLEYLANGLYVITNDFTFQKNFLSELKGGVTYIDYNSKALAKAIASILSITREQIQNQSIMNIEFIRTKACWNNQSKKLLEMFDSLEQHNEMLVCSYFYPPLGGPAVQRSCKTIKYLSKLGWDCDVLTVKSIFYHSQDLTLLNECSERQVFKANSFDPMAVTKSIKADNPDNNSFYFRIPEGFKVAIKKLFPIDDKIGWLIPAVLKGIREAKRNNYRFIFTTMGPYTAGLIGYYISKSCNIPLIVDYRDHWTINPYDDNISLLKPLSVHWEKKILNHSKLVTVIGNVMKEQLCDRFGSNLSSKIHVLYNGFDESDFTDYKRSPSKLPIVISYIGNFYRNRTPKFFVEAIKELRDEGFDFSNISFRFVGNYFREARECLEDSKVADILEIVPQVTHEEVIKKYEETSGLLLFIANENGKGVITGKLFEYLRSGIPILAMIPQEGEAAQILRSTGNNLICSIDDVDVIKNLFKKLVLRIQAEVFSPKLDSKYSREEQTKLLNQRLNTL